MGARIDRTVNAIRGQGAPPAFLIIFFVIILYILDLIYGFNGFDWANIASTPWKVLWAIPLNLLVFINLFLFFMMPAGGKTLVSRLFFSFVILNILTLGGFNGGGMFHLFIPLLIWFFWARNVYDEESANMIIGFLLLIDYYGYGFLQHYLARAAWSSASLIKLFSNRLIFPIWGYFALFESYKFEKDPISTILLILLFGTTIFYLVDDSTAALAHLGYINPEMRTGLLDYLVTGYNRFTTTIKKIPAKLKDSYEDQLEYATGGYYRGQVEENAEAPLGVFIENIITSSDRYFQDESIIIWADLKARTLKDPIGIIMNCTTGEEATKKDGEIKPDYFEDKEIQFNISAAEEEGIQCKLPNHEPGTHTVRLSAEFNFETMAYLKTYFMDVERMRALRRDEIDPLEQYGITEKSPVAVHTKGPVKIGLGTNDQLPIGLGEDYIQKPRLGITIENEWNGKIKDIDKLIIQIPKSMQLEPTDESTFCNGWFEAVDPGELADVMKDDNYVAYSLNSAGKKTFKFPIERFETIRCIIEIDRSSIRDVLGNTPIATHYYRADVKYTYFVEKTKSIKVIKTPGKTKIDNCEDVCEDDEGCTCTDEGCLAGGRDIPKGVSCGVPEEGSAPAALTIMIDNDSDGFHDGVSSVQEVLLLLGAHNAHACHLRNEASAWSSWSLFSPTKEWRLSDGPGLKTVYFQCKDREGQESEIVSAVIQLEAAT